MSKNLESKKTNKAVKKTISNPNKISINYSDRQKMIAEAAYFIAEKRNFAEGDPNEDWFSAEIEIDFILKNKQKSINKNNGKKKT